MNSSRSFASALRRAAKSFARRPAFFAVGISSLAIALGLATTVIAHIDSLIHPKTPTPFSKQLYFATFRGVGTSSPTDDELLAHFRSIAQVERASVVRQASVGSAVQLGAERSVVRLWRMNADAFDLLGATPLVGRWFVPGERAEANVALLSEDAWRQKFASTRDLRGIRLWIDDLAYSVVGVIPRGLPPFAGWGEGDRPQTQDADVVVPDRGANPSSTRISATVMLRIRNGANTEQLVDNGPRISAAVEQQHGGTQQQYAVRFSPFKVFGTFESTAYEQAMFFVVAIIIVIACANVSALMLARAVTRRRDQALRLSLGAERRHLITDVVAEITLIAFGGAIGGLLVSDWSMRLLAAFTPADLPWLGFREPHWSPWVFVGLLFTVMIAVAIASVVPAMFVSSVSPAEQLKDTSGNTTGRTSRAFQGLVVAEIALSLVLIVGAVLVAKSADRVAAFDFGYEPRGLVSIRPQVRVGPLPAPPRPGVTLTNSVYPSVSLTELDDIVTRLRREPGLRDAAWMIGATDNWHKEVMLADASARSDGRLYGVEKFFAGPGFLRTLGLRLVNGRDLSESDHGGRGAVVLDRVAAQRLFPDGDAIGRMVKFGTERAPGPWLPVVGIVESAVHTLPADPAVPIPPTAYALIPNLSSRQAVHIVVRGESRDPDVTSRAAAIVGDLLPPTTAYRTEPWLSRFDRVTKTRRFIAGMFLALSFASLGLAVAGLFGVLSYGVTQRRREFATRIALGAQQRHVVGLVLRDGFVMALGGTAVGAAVSMYAAFVLWKWLWGVYPIDAEALVISEGILVAITAIAAIVPSVRATRANPVDVMRAT